MIKKIKKLYNDYNSVASDIQFHQDEETRFDWNAQDALEALANCLQKQHEEFLARVADEYAVTQLENRMLGYGGR